MRQETVRHLLGVAVRVDDHFVADPIDDEVDVMLDDVAPTPIRGGGGVRHADGTYRFVDVEERAYQLRIDPGANWMLLDALPSVTIPFGPVRSALVVSAWPTPAREIPIGMTAVRGKLLGTPAATIARRIEFDVAGASFPHYTQSDSFGEFVFLFPGHLELDVDSLVDVALRVPGSVVDGGEFVTPTTTFAGASFRITPGRETRVRFHVT